MDLEWADAVRILALNESVDQYNNSKLQALAAKKAKVHKLVAWHGIVKRGHVCRAHVPVRAFPKQADNSGGLREHVDSHTCACVHLGLQLCKQLEL